MRILITGKNGYIANELNKYIKASNENYLVSQASIRNHLDTINFSEYDVVIHAAAIVHKKESTQSENKYKEINTDLTIQIAQKAKQAGVKHFIFLSTMAVFGVINGEISDATQLKPISLYGKSKLNAENELVKMESDDFTVAIIRPPMVYGPNCPGNYAQLSKLGKKTFIFPKIDNKRSMIFIYNLSEFIYQVIVNESSGIFHPQNKEYINTSKMVKKIAINSGKKLYEDKITGNLIKLFLGNSKIYQKVFGDLFYSQSFSNYRDNTYQKYSFYESIKITEKGYL